MFCPQCGTQNDEARFCRQCGTALAETVVDSHSGRSGPKLVGWLLVAIGLGASFVPDSVVPQEGSKLIAFVLLTAGFGLVLSGTSAIRRLGAGAVAAAVIVFPLYYLRSSMPGTATGANAGAMDVQMSVLLSDYSSNEVAADQRYKGHLIRVHGVVSDIKKDLMDNPFVLLNSGDGFRTVQCAFASSAVNDVARLKTGEAVTLQGVVQGLMVNVQVTDCTVVRDVPAVQPVASMPSETNTPSAPPATSPDAVAGGVVDVVRKVAALAAVTSDGLGTDWDQLGGITPMDRWTDLADKEFAVGKQAETAGVAIAAKGSQTVVQRWQVDREFTAADEPSVLESAFAASFPVAPVRCDSQELASMFERWYVVSPVGTPPVIVKYEFSSGNAGGVEGLTFQAGAELPKVGDEAIGGTWSDRCSR